MKKQTKITWALMGVVALSACGGLEKSRSLGPAADGGDAVTSEDAGNNYSKIGDGPIQPDVAIKSPDSRDNSEADAPVSVDGPPRNDGSQSPDAPTCTTPASCCKGCWDGTKCQTGSDVSACGVGGASCKVCNDGNPCTADKCTAGACEADKLTGATCPTGVCASGVCHCGAPGEPCCTSGAACEGNQACQSNRCGSCGSQGAPCCPGNECAAGNRCATGGTCEACGGAGQPCCGNNQCNTGLTCGGGRCAACGGAGQPCCPSGNACQANLTCGSGNTCQCGGIGQACCGGNTCTDDGDPCNGTEVCQGTCQHQNPVICSALDVCHEVGQCQPATGKCTNPPKNGGSCNDSDSCTQNDTCVNGACKGSALVCSSGQRCVSGNCICDSTSCASGCCSANQCQTGTSNSACGSAGAGCGVCTSNQTCQSHSCTLCGGPGQICCTGQSCNAGSACSNGTCRPLMYDCLFDTNRSGTAELVNPGARFSTSNDSAAIGYFLSPKASQQARGFITFGCTPANAPSSLQQATLRVYLSYGMAPAADRVTVKHVVFDALSEMTPDRWTDPGLDMPGDLSPPNTALEYKTIDVTTSVRADLIAGRNTQFAFDIPRTSSAETEYGILSLPSGDPNHPPTLHLTFSAP